jgi:hypothetical protein
VRISNYFDVSSSKDKSSLLSDTTQVVKVFQQEDSREPARTAEGKITTNFSTDRFVSVTVLLMVWLWSGNLFKIEGLEGCFTWVNVLAIAFQ